MHLFPGAPPQRRLAVESMGNAWKQHVVENMASHIPPGSTRLQILGKTPTSRRMGVPTGNVMTDEEQCRAESGHSTLETTFSQQEQAAHLVVLAVASRQRGSCQRPFFGGRRGPHQLADAHMPHCGLHLHGRVGPWDLA